METGLFSHTYSALIIADVEDSTEQALVKPRLGKCLS